MEKKYRIISCMGCEKKLGKITTACSLLLEKSQNDLDILFKPSLAQLAAEKEGDSEEGADFVAINGCMSQCVNAILSERGLKPVYALNMPQVIKQFKLPKESEITPDILQEPVVEQITSEIKETIREFIKKREEPRNISDDFEFSPEFNEDLEFTYGKYHFEVPVAKNKLYFNWNDAWAYDIGDGKVVVGITDYLQKNLSDIIICELPEIGKEIGQFEEVATLESSKTVNDLLTPFSGKVVHINEELEMSPELINEHPHTKGWVAVLQTQNFAEEKDELMGSEDYFDFMKGKVEEEGVH